MLSDAAFYLAGNGHEIHVVTSRLSYEGDKTFDSEETIRQVRVHRLWTTGFGRTNLAGRALDYLSFYVMVFIKLLMMLGREDVVVAKTDPPMVSVPVGWAARIKGAPSINWLQDLFPEVAEVLDVRFPGPLRWLLMALRDNSLLNAEQNVVIGDLMRTRLLKIGCHTDSVTTVPNWSDGDDIKPDNDGENLRDAWQLADKFVVGYSGNLGRAHEISTLVRAVEKLESDESLAFLLIGGGALMNKIRLECPDTITYEPYQPRERLASTLTLPDVHLTILRPEMEGLIVPSKFYGILAAGKPQIFIGAKGWRTGSCN